MDEHVVVEVDDLGRRRLEIGDVGFHVQHAQQRHAPEQAADNRRRLVMGEIDAAGRQEQPEDPAKLLVGDGRSAFALVGVRRQIRMLRDFDDLGRDVGRRRHDVDHLRCDRGPRHPVVFGGGRILREREAFHRLDFADADCAIRCRARQHDADGVRTERARERSKEKIDGVVLAPIGRPPAQMEMAVDELHLRVRRHDVHAIGRDAHTLGGLQNGQRSVARKKRRQRTCVVGREMLDEDDREVGIAWQPLEKLRECLESSSRRARRRRCRSRGPAVRRRREAARRQLVFLVGRAAA